jgi:hypothetical protein
MIETGHAAGRTNATLIDVDRVDFTLVHLRTVPIAHHAIV